MNTSSIQKLLISLLIIPWLIETTGTEKIPKFPQKNGVKYSGLTGTLVNLLKTRAPNNFVIGAYGYSLEDMIDTDIATVFDCDSVISSYLSEANEGANYEMLSDAMRNVIWERFKSDDQTLFVNVRSDSISGGMYFNYSVSMNKSYSIPIFLNASDTSFSTSFDTTCTVKFESDITLFINVKKVNSGSLKDGVRVRINKFSFELTSDTEEEVRTYENDYLNNESIDTFKFVQRPHMFFPFYLEGKKYIAAARRLSIYAKSYWYLVPIDASDFVVDEGECYTLTYKQLEKGDFKWDNETLSSFSANLVMVPAEEKWDSQAYAKKGNEFSYAIDNLFNNEGFEQISFCCDYRVNEGVTVRKSNYVLKR